SRLLYLQEKKEILQRTDTLFSEFLEKAVLRFNKGASNLLEKATAENQRGQIALQLAQLQQDLEIVRLQFQLLLNTSTVFIPAEKVIAVNGINLADSSVLSRHPGLLYLKQKEAVAAAGTGVEKSRLLPELVLGYNIMGMNGAGADNKEYNGALRFQSVQVGLGVPLFNSAQKARIKAAMLNERIVREDYIASLKTFTGDWQAARVQYANYAAAKNYFESTALKNATDITRTATQQFLNGDINYLEWVMVIHQAVSIERGYAEV